MAGKLAEILRSTLAEYEQSYKLSLDQRKACAAVIRCRTGELGKVLASCRCGYRTELPASCRNRHCPICQSDAAFAWKERYRNKLPEVPTYHGVFTVPCELHPLFQSRPRELYALLFDAVAETLQRFSNQDRRLAGARLGVIALLHTWGSQLQFHPHLHLLICGGGFTPQGQWKQIEPSRGYLFRVQSLSKVFRAMLLEKIERCVDRHPQRFGLPIEQIRSLLRRAALKQWRVFIQRSRKNALYALDYLGRYTHRVAISEARIQSFEAGQVRISCRRKRGESFHLGSLQLQATEFMRRFLAHILPGGFHKVRAYGFFVRGWQKALQLSRRLLVSSPIDQKRGARLCPCCSSILSYTVLRFPVVLQTAVPP